MNSVPTVIRTEPTADFHVNFIGIIYLALELNTSCHIHLFPILFAKFLLIQQSQSCCRAVNHREIA